MRKLPDKKQLRRERIWLTIRLEPIATERKLRTITSHPPSETKVSTPMSPASSTLRSYVIRDPCLGNSATYSGLSSWSVNSQVNPPTDKSDKGNYSSAVFSPGVSNSWQPTFKTNHHKRPSVERKQPDTAGHTEHLQVSWGHGEYRAWDGEEAGEVGRSLAVKELQWWGFGLNFYSWFPGVGRLKSRVLRQCCATEDHSRWEMVAIKRTVVKGDGIILTT